MKRMMKLVAGMLCLMMILSACGGTAPAASQPSEVSNIAPPAGSGGAGSPAAVPSTGTKAENRDTLVLGLPGEPGKIDPQNNILIHGMMMCRQMYDPLIDKDRNTGELIPGLATEWEWVDDTHLKMKLREGVTFHDGTPFTAEDVKYTVSRFKTGSATSSLYAAFNAEETEVVDDHTVIIAFDYPFAPTLNFLTNGRAYIVSKAYMEANGDECLNQYGMGTGSFKFKEWQTGTKVILEKNDNYWGEKAKVQYIDLVFIHDNSARMIALETGAVDIAFELVEDDIDRALKGESPGVIGFAIPSWKVWYLAFNTEMNEVLANPKARLAIAHAVDWANAVTVAGGSVVKPAKSCLASTIFAYKEVGLYDYNPELSKQLLAEAGYPDGFEITANIEEVTIVIRTLEIAQAQLAEVGIKLNINAVDAATCTEMNIKGLNEVTVGNMTAMTGDPAHTLNATSQNAAQITGRVPDKKYNDLFNAGMAEMDTDKRRAIYEELQDYIFEQAFQIPMYEQVITSAIRDYVIDYTPDAGLQTECKWISIA